MGLEIERKFLVVGEGFKTGAEASRIRQGFLSKDPERLVRIRIREETAWLTIKGPLKGISRLEFEYRIPREEAENLLLMCVETPIDKVRYQVRHEGLEWEVDVFEGANAGLVIAEVELPFPDYAVQLPAWAGQEVTHDLRYYNMNLVSHPYTTWNPKE